MGNFSFPLGSFLSPRPGAMLPISSEHIKKEKWNHDKIQNVMGSSKSFYFPAGPAACVPTRKHSSSAGTGEFLWEMLWGSGCAGEEEEDPISGCSSLK